MLASPVQQPHGGEIVYERWGTKAAGRSLLELRRMDEPLLALAHEGRIEEPLAQLFQAGARTFSSDWQFRIGRSAVTWLRSQSGRYAVPRIGGPFFPHSSSQLTCEMILAPAAVRPTCQLRRGRRPLRHRRPCAPRPWPCSPCLQLA